MKNETAKAINEILDRVEESAILSSGYKPGDNVVLFLDHAVNEMSGSKIEDLWGPGWSVFLAMMIDRLERPVSAEITMSGMKAVLCNMIGHSEITPALAMVTKTGLPVGGVSNPIDIPDFTTENQITLASKVCNDLDIASPTEVSYLYDALGVGTTPKDAALLYGLKIPGKPIASRNIPSMLRNLESRRAFKAVEEAVLQTEKAAEQTKKVVTRCQGDITSAIQLDSTEQIAEQVRQAVYQLQRGAVEAAQATAEAVKATIEAEQGMAKTMRDIALAHRHKDQVVITQTVGHTPPTQSTSRVIRYIQRMFRKKSY